MVDKGFRMLIVSYRRKKQVRLGKDHRVEVSYCHNSAFCVE